MNETYPGLPAFPNAALELEHLGDAAGELRAAAAGDIAVPLAHRTLIRVAGEDAVAFLQNLLTNDVKGLPASRAQYNGMCTAKGRLLASFLLWREGGDCLLQLPRELREPIQRKLSMYVLRSKVKVTDAGSEVALFGVSGPRAADAVRQLAGEVPAAALDLQRFDGGVAIRLGESRFELAVPAAGAGEVWEALAASARPAGTAAWRWLEIQGGVPTVTAATQEEFVPQMVNFELLGGVNFQKGCYPGQEIVARTQYLGKLKRRMYLARTDGAAAPGTALYSPDLPDQACGTVVDSAPSPEGGQDLLAVIQMSSAEAGDVRLARPDGPPLAFKPLPYPLS